MTDHFRLISGAHVLQSLPGTATASRTATYSRRAQGEPRDSTPRRKSRQKCAGFCAVLFTCAMLFAVRPSGAMAPNPDTAASSSTSLYAFYCAKADLLGAASDICTVKITGAAKAATSVRLTSSSPGVVQVPSSVTLPKGSAALQFAVPVASVPASQTVTLSANDGMQTLTFNLKLTGATKKLALSTSQASFNYVALGTSAQQTVTVTSTGTLPVTLRGDTLSGSDFSVSGASLPTTLPPGRTTSFAVRFTPAGSGQSAANLTLLSDADAGSSVVALRGTGGNAPLTAFYCASGSVLGTGTDICTVKLSSASTSNAQTVTLSSNNTAVSIPAQVSIAQGTSNVQFPATIGSVRSTLSVALSASAGGASQTYTIKLNPLQATMNLSRNAIAFTGVPTNTTATQSVTVSSVGTAPVTISSLAVSDASFSVPGAATPLTIAPGHTATIAVQFRPTAYGSKSGQLVIASNSSSGTATTVNLNGTAINSTGTAAAHNFSYGGSSLATVVESPSTPGVIGSSFFGMTISHLAPNSMYAQPNMTPFPSLAVSTMRFWDVDYWSMIDSFPGQNNWLKLDNSVNIGTANGVSDFIFTFGNPPSWASTDPLAQCPQGEGPGTCAMPNLSALDDFATRVVQRYCGKIKHYEPWNEPDNPSFWNGSKEQMLQISQHVYKIAKDPANCGCTDGKCSPGGGANPNSVLLPPISNIGADSLGWLDDYLTLAGSKPYADIATFHNYGFVSDPEGMTSSVAAYRQVLNKHGLSKLQQWDTEASWEWNSNLSDTDQAGWLMRFHTIQAALGVSRFIWYSYENCTWGTLYASPLCPSSNTPYTQLTSAGNAYGTIENWLVGATITHCQQYQNGLWACELSRSGGADSWMLWASKGKSISVAVPTDLGLKQYRDWENQTHALSANLSVTSMPVLLEP